MPIYQTASNKWQVNFRKKGVAFKKTVASKTEADALERECQRCFDYNLPLPDSKNSSFGMTSSILFQRTAQKYWADTDWGIVQIRRQEKILDVLHDGKWLELASAKSFENARAIFDKDSMFNNLSNMYDNL